MTQPVRAQASGRFSFDLDVEVADRFAVVLEAAEVTDGWATSVRAWKPTMTIMGKLGGIEAGLRQLRRRVPLDTQLLALPSGREVRIPTLPEALRVKAYLIAARNQVRDYLDVVALADQLGVDRAAAVLADMDQFYLDRSQDQESVATALAMRLARPDPRDRDVLADLPRYKGLVRRWQDWAEIRRACADLAQGMLDHV